MIKKRVSIVLITLVIAILAIPLTGLYLASDSYSLVHQGATVETGNVIKAKSIAKSLYSNLVNGPNNQTYSMTMSEDDINSVIGLVIRGIPRLNGRANVSKFGIIIALSMNFDENPFGRFINLSTTIIPSSYGLVIDEMKIGDISISGKLALALAEILANRITQSDSIGSELMSSIKSISVERSEVMVRYQSLPGLKLAIDSAKSQFKTLRDDLELVLDPALVRPYYRNLCDFHSKIDGLGEASLGYYLSHSFSFAGKRSTISGAAVEENRAALMALAIFLGDGRFNSVVGAIDASELDKCQPQNSKIVLAQRQDLRLHFIFSSALKIIADSGVSFAIGEFKELLDSAQGGSGFSFADLAADKAGVIFAEFAVNPVSAKTLQSEAARLQDEMTFFPSIDGLPENISRDQFDANGGLEGSIYVKQLTNIESRINNLALYK